MEFPGPHCQLAGTSSDCLNTKKLQECKKVTNGLVLEIFDFCRKKCLKLNEICEIFSLVNTEFKDVKPQTLHSRVSTVSEKKKKLVSKKKVPGYKNIQDLLNGEFVPCIRKKKCDEIEPNNVPTELSIINTIVTTDIGLQKVNTTYVSPQKVKTTYISPQPVSPKCMTNSYVQTDFEANDCEKEVTKKWNFKKYLCNKQTRKLRKIQKQIKQEQERLATYSNRVGHYSVKNVTKRDDTARKNLHLLRDAQRKIRTQEKELKKKEQRNREYRETNILLEKKLSTIEREQQLVISKLENEKLRKVTAQKSNSKLRLKLNGMKHSIVQIENENQMKDFSQLDEKVISLKHKLSERDMMISDLEQELNEQKENLTDIRTRSDNGTYTENVRMCVIQLAGLEVATEKVSPVIDVVSQNLFSKKFTSKELPNSSTVQSMVDEGHYVAKMYLKERIENSENWGLNRDGTTRRKQKIVDTSITLDNGEIASLGFTHVARETAQTIHDVTKNHLHELSNIPNSKIIKDGQHYEAMSEDFVVSSLAKLAFTMSDRASNEKLADKLLSKWRDEMLQKCNVKNEIKTVKHFHCMAHVLLGFHKYICDDIKMFEKSLVESSGPLGRDTLPVFKFWSKKGTVIERVVRTTADIFGPAGDHYGLRDRWEAYCTKKGIKSIIGNYRDNRFNGIFQTAAEILVHRADFLEVINTVSDPNLKIQAVQADLNSENIKSLLKSLGCIFVKITGPYWELVTSGKVPYVKLYPHIQSLHKYLQTCCENPKTLLDKSSCWTDPEYDIPNYNRFWEVISDCDENVCNSAIALMCKSMTRTVEKQLCDFMPNGEFRKESNDHIVSSTKFAKVTNLGCEHHFGDLDSSQKRRPNATMHHHSSIQLLKRNRKQVKKWYDDMTDDEKKELWRNARKGGKEFRTKHCDQEKRVASDICDLMEKPKRKHKVKDTYSLPEEESELPKEFSSQLPNMNTINVHDYVAVAYQDAWYPGCVLKKANESMSIKFMAPCKKPGTFIWPAREDIQTVCSEFLLASGMMPECISSGRQWSFPNYKEVDKLLMLYKELFF